jgi:hypothetical protein
MNRPHTLAPLEAGGVVGGWAALWPVVVVEPLEPDPLELAPASGALVLGVVPLPPVRPSAKNRLAQDFLNTPPCAKAPAAAGVFAVIGVLLAAFGISACDRSL